MRVARPPGGFSTFSFNDGSSSVRSPPKRRIQPAHRDLDSLIIKERSGESVHRHTNGLKRVDSQQAPQYMQQPPGGRSTFSFNDGWDNGRNERKAAVWDRGLPQTDSLSDFVSQHDRGVPHAAPFQAPSQGSYQLPPASYDPRPTAALRLPAVSGGYGVSAPPGGHSSFSLGWGADGSGNHHHDYARRRQYMGVVGDRSPRGVGPSSGHSGSGGQHGGAPYLQPARDGDQYGGGGQQGGGGLFAGRNSTRVVAPPGGLSSIHFG